MVRVETFFLRSFTHQDVYVFSLMSFPSQVQEVSYGFSVHSLRAKSTLAEIHSPSSLLFIHNNYEVLM